MPTGESENLEQTLGGPYASRGGFKLAHALRRFAIDPTGWTCADLGCSTGGFTDCLLKHGAARVYAVDTAYGELAWTLRQDPRVVVMERSNVMHVTASEPVRLVTIDVSWTPAKRAVDAGVKWLGAGGKLIVLVKPHYEAKGAGVDVPRGGVLADEDAERVAQVVSVQLGSMPGLRLAGFEPSPIRGGKAGTSGKARTGGGNREWLALLEQG